MAGMASSGPQANSVRFPLGFAENPEGISPPTRDGVVLDGASIHGEGTGRQALRDIVSIQLWPFGKDAGREGFCDIRFRDGALLRIFSLNAGAGECGLAYAGFLRRLHGALDADTRTHIAFLDGMPGPGACLIAVGGLFGTVVMAGSLYKAATAGPVWLIGTLPWLAAMAAYSVWRYKASGPHVYSPDCLPAHALPHAG